MIAISMDTSLVTSILPQERRASDRSISARRMLARPFGPEFKEEVQTISNMSHDGLYFETRSRHYLVGMPICVVEGYTPETRYNTPSFGKVIRVERLKDGGSGVAVQILMR